MKLNYLKAIRYGVSSCLKPLGMDIYTPDFERSKKSYDATSTQLKKHGKESFKIDTGTDVSIMSYDRNSSQDQSSKR